MHDVRDYDRFKSAITATNFSRLREWTEERQRREIDPLVASLASGLRVIFSANPDALGHIDASAAAQLLLDRWPRPRFERI